MAEQQTQSLAVRPMEYEMANGEKMTLTMETVKRFLVQGRKEFITESELMYFMHECKARKLNPFLRECWLIKYSSKDNAQIVESIHHKRAKARRSEDCQGWSKGIIVRAKDGETIKDTNGLLLEGEALLGGFFEATPKGWSGPWRLEVNLVGYIKKKADGKLTRFWAPENQPSQIAKVAESQGLSALWGDTVGHAVIPGEIAPGDDVIDMEFATDRYEASEKGKAFADLAAEKTTLPNKALDEYKKLCAAHRTEIARKDDPDAPEVTIEEFEKIAVPQFPSFWDAFERHIAKKKERSVSEWTEADWKAWVDTWKSKGAAFVGLSMSKKFKDILKAAPSWVQSAHKEKWTRDTMAKYVEGRPWPLAPPEEPKKEIREDILVDQEPLPDFVDPGPQPPPSTPGQKTQVQKPARVGTKRSVDELMAERDEIADKILVNFNTLDIRTAMDGLGIEYQLTDGSISNLKTKTLSQVNDIAKALRKEEIPF